MGVGLKLADAEPPRDADRILFVFVSKQPQRARLRGKLISGQQSKLREPPQRIAG
jgi:hypothetical protein